MDHQKDHSIQVLETQPMAVLSCMEMMGVDEFGRYYGVLYERFSSSWYIAPKIPLGVTFSFEFNRECNPYI